MTTAYAYREQEDWKSEFLDFITHRLDEIERDDSVHFMDDISKALFRNRQDIMGQAALALINKKYGHLLDHRYCQCPCCGGRIKASGNKVKREITTIIGSIQIYRPYFYCKSCRHGFYPLDEALGLCNRKIQPDVQELEAWLAAEMPYEIACESFQRCTGIEVSDHHMHEVTNDIAKDLDVLDVCPDKEQIHQQIDELSKGNFRRPILMLGIDGAHAPTRPEPSPRKGARGKGQWKEVKGFRLYLLSGKRIIHLISWHQIKSDKELAADLSRIKNAGLIPEGKVRIGVIGDGAPWIINRAKEIFPTAKFVLDYYHCSEYLHELAHAQYGKETQEADEWVEATLTRLFCNDIEEVLAEMREMQPSSEAAKEQIDKTQQYLSERKGNVDYGSLKRGGYHIGSGAMESSNKFISNVRLKRSGAWWYPTNANNILKLRCAKYNGTFDRIMENYKNNFKQKRVESTESIRLIVDNS
jgi:hypothetical protein